jgi:hypothetical protein
VTADEDFAYEFFADVYATEELYFSLGDAQYNDGTFRLTITQENTTLDVTISPTSTMLLVIANYTANNHSLVGLRTSCSLRENASGTWSPAYYLSYTNTTQTYQHSLPLTDLFWFQLSCQTPQPHQNISLIDYYQSGIQENTIEYLPDDTRPTITALEEYLPSINDSNETIFFETNLSSETPLIIEDLYETMPSSAMTGEVYSTIVMRDHATLSLLILEDMNASYLFSARYLNTSSQESLTGLQTTCSLRENSQGTWSSPQQLWYSTTYRAYEHSLQPTQDEFLFELLCQAPSPYENITIIDSLTLQQLPDSESYTLLAESYELYAGINSATQLHYQHAEGLFTATTTQGELAQFGVSDDLEITFTVVNVTPEPFTLKLDLPFSVPEGLHFYLWKTLSTGNILVPYELSSDRTTLQLTLQDGVIDNDETINGIVVDPLQLTLPTYEFSVQTTPDNTQATVIVDSRELVVTTPNGVLDTVALVDPLNLPDLPGTPNSFTHKLVRFTADTLGDEALDVYLTYDALPPVFSLWKFNSQTQTWYMFPYERIDDQTLRITIIDGGFGDDDGLVNGKIVDDIGILVGDTSLHIGDLSDTQTVYTTQNNYFYANYTNRTTNESITGADVYCEFTENSTGSWSTPINMTYNVTSKVYEFAENYSAGNFTFNVSCYNEQGYENITLSDAATITTYVDNYPPGLQFLSSTPQQKTIGLVNATLTLLASDETTGNASISTFINFEQDVISWWTMSNRSGNTLYDQFNYTTGTLYNSPVSITGALGAALDFNGASQYVLLDDGIPLTSVSLWANFSTISATSYFLGGTSQGIRYSGTEFLVFNGGTGWTTVPWTKQNDWVHFVAVHTGSANYDIYINAEKIGTSYAGAGETISITRFGRRADSYYFDGPLDDIIFFNKSLTQQEISALYANSSTSQLAVEYTSLATGNYTYTAYAQDTKGNIAQTTSWFVVDTTAPIITLHSPEEKVYVNQSQLLNISASDTAGIDLIWYSWNGTNVTYTSPLLLTFPENSTTLRVWANDSAGNVASTNVTFVVNLTYIDVLIPNITILSPVATSYNVHNLSVSLQVTDDVTVDTIFYSWNGTNTTYTQPLHILFPQGTTTLDVWANDTSGNTNTASVTFFIDSLAPIVSFEHPTPNAGESYSFTSALMNASTSDIARGSQNVSVFVDVDNSLRGWWRIDDTVGETLVDYTGQNSGTVQGTPQKTAGYFGQGLLLDGQTQYATLPPSNSLGITSELTLSTWFTCLPDSHGEVSGIDAGRMINVHRQSPGTTMALIVGSDGLGWYNSGTSAYDTDGVNPCDDTWHLATLTLDADGTMRLYKDGALVRTRSGGSMTFSSYPVMLGSYDGTSRFFNGTLDDVMIFNRSLQAEEVAALFATTAEQELLVSYPTLDERNFSFTAYTQDTFANVDTTLEHEFYVDSLAPRITILWPQASVYDYQLHELSLTVEDPNLATIWYSWNGTNVTYTAPINITFPEDTITLHVWANDSLGNLAYSNRTFQILLDWPPELVTQTPQQNFTSVQTINFSCAFTDDFALANASLYLTNELNTSFTFNGSTSLTGTNATATWLRNLAPGRYTWNCVGYDNISFSVWGENRTLFVNEQANATYTLFDGTTTDFNAHPTPEAITGALIEQVGQGRIAWQGVVNATSQNFDLAINITADEIFVNASRLHPSFNTSANLTFYNRTMVYPVIYRNGQLCTTCNVLSYGGGTLVFSVAGFSSYTTGEGTNLSLWDLSDTQVVFNDEDNYYYANYTNITDGSAITGANVYCAFTENSTGSWSVPVNMTFDAGDGLYYYNKTTSWGLFTYNVSCFNDVGFANLSTSDTANITRRPTKELFIQHITFSTNTPQQDQLIQIFVNITNAGNETAENFTFAMNASLWNGTHALFDETVTQTNITLVATSSSLLTFNWTVQPGTYIFDGFVDSENVVVELDETNNTFSTNLTTSAWGVVHGKLDQRIALGVDADKVIEWNLSDKIGNIFFYDYDATVDLANLAPLGTQPNDFALADEALGMTGFTDSISARFDANDDDAPDMTRTITLLGTNITDVPVIYSTNSSSPFLTGILWDATGGGPYDGSQPLVIVGLVQSNTTGLYGTYDYEVALPTLLQSWTGANDYFYRSIEFY